MSPQSRACGQHQVAEATIQIEAPKTPRLKTGV